MSQNDLFAHSNPLQENINKSVYRALKRLDGNELILRHKDDQWHADLAYDLYPHFGREERKVCGKNADKLLPLIMEAVHQLVRNHTLEFKLVDKGRRLVLTIGHSDPKQLPELTVIRPKPTQQTRRRKRRFRANRPTMAMAR